MLEIKVTEPDGYTLFQPHGELDAFSVGQFREALAGLATVGKLVIDLSGVPFMDSAGLGALIGGIRRIRDASGQVTVACSRPTLTRLLQTTQFDKVVTVTASVDEAAAAFS